MAWSFEAWRAIEPVFTAITQHPFVTGLIDGSLAKEKFLFYQSQDYLYLNDFSRSLGAIATRLENMDDSATFLEFAQGALKERELHLSYLGGVEPTQKLPPSCELYVSFLGKILAFSPVETAAASILPCFWIYKKVGDFILAAKPSPQNPYRDWINLYGGEEFATLVNKALAIIDRLAAATSPKVRLSMTEVFVMASRLEWMFWDSAWRLEEWPV
ncbi:MAG: TenA family protein [Deltaproteobacteria bacterium]|jgi:thiaminase/transcriptional activator TenA|nr:TenA family protein [Deltaproteobacteria bacterium]